MDKIVKYIDLGLIDYKAAWKLQEKTLAKALASRATARSEEVLFLCEHQRVYTLGKSGKENNLLINQHLLEQRNIQLVKTNRGGDITYHGPGQLVGYPIIDLSLRKMGVKQYIEKLEECIIQLLKKYNIRAKIKENYVGIWAENQGQLKKICSIGVRVSRGVTMHGFALNIHNDLSYFSNINPCGFKNEAITSMQATLKKKIPIQEVKHEFMPIFMENFS